MRCYHDGNSLRHIRVSRRGRRAHALPDVRKISGLPCRVRCLLYGSMTRPSRRYDQLQQVLCPMLTARRSRRSSRYDDVLGGSIWSWLGIMYIDRGSRQRGWGDISSCVFGSRNNQECLWILGRPQHSRARSWTVFAHMAFTSRTRRSP